MNNYDKSNTGAIFQRKKKSNNSPDMGGTITIAGDLLDYIVQNARSGSVDIDVAAWRKTDRSGAGYYSMKVSRPWKEDQERRSAPTERAPYRQEYNQQYSHQGRQDFSSNQQAARPSYGDVRQGAAGQFNQRRVSNQNDLDDEIPF